MKKKVCFCLISTLLAFCICLCLAAEQRVFIYPEKSRIDKSKDLMRLYVLDLLGADCMLLKCRDDVMLIDLGRDSQYDQLKTMLKGLNVKSLDVFNTHPHNDHTGGLIQLLDEYNVKRFYTLFKKEKYPRSVSRKLAEKKVNVKLLSSNDSLPFNEDVSIEILQNKYGMNLNEQSAALKISLNKAKLFLTADISAGSQRYFIDKWGADLDADIMKSPHHGIEDLKSDFISSVAPEFCFFTHGEADTKKMQKTLKKHKVPCLFATHGIIYIVTDGETWYVRQLGTTKRP